MEIRYRQIELYLYLRRITGYLDFIRIFLKNMFGSSCAEMVPNLKKLQAVVFGKVVKSERPVVVEIPYDQNKV